MLGQRRGLLGEPAKPMGEQQHWRDLVGRTDGNHATIFDGDPSLAGDFVKVRVTRATASALYGELVPGSER